MDLLPPSKTLLGRIRKLHNRKARRENRRFLAEGLRVLDEGFACRLVCRSVLVSEGFLREKQGWMENRIPQGVPVYVLTEKDFRGVSTTVRSQGILGEFDIPQNRSIDEIGDVRGLLVVLHELRDPGNVGTVIRCAAGLGTGGVVGTRGCVDFWNPKTVRASAGAGFRLPLWEGLNVSDLEPTLRRCGFEIWVADPGGESIWETVPETHRVAMVFGNESRGAGEIWESAGIVRKIGIPLCRDVESLNVGAAAAILTAVFGNRLR